MLPTQSGKGEGVCGGDDDGGYGDEVERPDAPHLGRAVIADAQVQQGSAQRGLVRILRFDDAHYDKLPCVPLRSERAPEGDTVAAHPNSFVVPDRPRASML